MPTGRIVPVLCSVTFRDRSSEGVLSLAVENGIEAIEWGADVQVPPGDVVRARRVGDATRAAGLRPGFLRLICAGGRCGRGGGLRACPCVGEGARHREHPGLGGAAQRARGERGGGFQNRPRPRGHGGIGRGRGESRSASNITATRRPSIPTTRARCSMPWGHDNLFTYWQPVPGRGRAACLEELEMLQPHLG